MHICMLFTMNGYMHTYIGHEWQKPLVWSSQTLFRKSCRVQDYLGSPYLKTGYGPLYDRKFSTWSQKVYELPSDYLTWRQYRGLQGMVRAQCDHHYRVNIQFIVACFTNLNPDYKSWGRLPLPTSSRIGFICEIKIH